VHKKIRDSGINVLNDIIHIYRYYNE